MVEDEIVTSIDKTLMHKYDKEDSLRMVFQNARHVAQGEISELLADFRNKRALGKLNVFFFDGKSMKLVNLSHFIS